MRKFTTAEKPAPIPIDFELDGRPMTFTPPGWAPMLLMAEGTLSGGDDPTAGLKAVRVFLDWLGAGLSSEDGDHILARLQDPADPFDLDDVLTIMEGITEEVAARPTTPPSVSKPSPPPTSSTGGRHREGSTPEDLTSVASATSPTTF